MKVLPKIEEFNISTILGCKIMTIAQNRKKYLVNIYFNYILYFVQLFNDYCVYCIILSRFLLRRMSLAMYAESVNNENTTNNTYNQNTKRNTNNRTQKRYSNPTNTYNVDKVNSALDAIHKSNNSIDNTLGDFKPLAPPVSMGVENTKINSPNAIEDDDIDLNDLKKNYMDEKIAEQYYKQFIPNYNKNSPATYNQPFMPSHLTSDAPSPFVPQQINSSMANGKAESFVSNDTLMTKLNYMIHLLEEKQDERTNNVTEEVVLYSFLGIFMIFIVDSFVRVGKYVR